MSYSPNAVSFIKPWKFRHICPFPQRLLSGHSVQWGVLRHILRSTMTDKRLTRLALMNIHTDLEIDSEEGLKQFDTTGTRALRFRSLRHILRSPMTDKRLTGLALMNIHTDLEIDSEEVLKQFDATGTRAMLLGCNPLCARVCECACVCVFSD